ncbi:hypothetical protein SEUCBS139899_006981 [Sporothrix eucalyptigena]|uniref:Acyltransferase 3 domain-containing protein n=1 Tax=Sporothrix eucalyptigena TaxID=1812306 RepID=A0ABP0C354_9PEZI
MASASLRGLRRWASSQMQPLYDSLPTAENQQHLNDEKGVEIGSFNGSSSSSNASSSSSSDSPRSHDEFRLVGHDRMFSKSVLGKTVNFVTTAIHNIVATLMILPMLILRVTQLVYLMITQPIRKFLGLSPGLRTAPAPYTPSPSWVTPADGWWPNLYVKLEEFQVLVPSFLQPVKPGTQPKKLHPTAWLDGLRGVAAFFVVWHHASLLWFSWDIHRGYHSENSARTNWLIQLPILRLVVSGPPHVAVFFVISGYALSYKPLRLSRQGRHTEAGEAIHSSVFRRHTRLFLMPALISFIAALLTYLDLYGGKDWKGVAIPSRRPPRADTLSGQLKHWFRSFVTMVNPISAALDRGATFMYDQNEWTLPVEFDMSMMLFLCQAAFNRFRPRMRMLFMSLLSVFALMYIHWHAFLFFSGMLICDLHFEFEGVGTGARPAPAPAPAPVPAVDSTSGAAEIGASQIGVGSAILPVTPIVSEKPPRRRYQRRITMIKIFCFILALFVLSIPDAGRGASHTPGYQTLAKWAPKFHLSKGALDFWYMPLAAVALVITIDRTPALQRIFSHPFPLYLGYISYSMYLIHGTVVWTLGHWAARKAIYFTGSGTQWQYGLCVLVSATVVWTATIILSDLATRTIDAKAVELGRVVYERCSQKEEKDVLPRTR